MKFQSSAISHQPLVSIIIVSYNTRALTFKSISSAYSSRGFQPGDIEVILVDNNSTDDTVAYVKNHLPRVVLIENHKNLGFGGGNNQGAAKAKGQYILLLNSDAFLMERSLRVMVDALAGDPELIAVGPQLRNADGTIQPSAGYLPTPLRIAAWMWWWDKLPLLKRLFSKPYHVFDPRWHQSEQHPEWLMGACVMFRRQEFLSAGGFDEKIFMYAEEVELFRRLQVSLGKKVLFTPKTQVVHLGRASSRQANALFLVRELQGIEYIYQKHYPNLLGIIRLVIKLGVLIRLAVFSFIPTRRVALDEYRQYYKSLL